MIKLGKLHSCCISKSLGHLFFFHCTVVRSYTGAVTEINNILTNDRSVVELQIYAVIG
jgi:hypothetical protein